MAGFVSRIGKTKNGSLYIDISAEIIKKMNLLPFMAGRIKAGKKSIILSDFEKTVKIKLDLDKKTIDIAKKIMNEEGYSSLDETFSNVIQWFITKKKSQVVYLYPKDYLKRGYTLIEDYEKRQLKG